MLSFTQHKNGALLLILFIHEQKAALYSPLVCLALRAKESSFLPGKSREEEQVLVLLCHRSTSYMRLLG